ncbi:acyclic terpene utilization AtuA family protein [uncultured Nevskia sp.]|uniref:acyclic terpene utilization AtuA family protein n=1 Tax=uncultured Nevskia sp. TaxID=228950 RepID=UPI0025D3A924|nr:acyclic terpene utilization AtuA family protein [uncultured Nevskia sp.]
MRPLRIGCGAGFWGDSAEGPRQLVRSGEIDVLVLDYLAEITMSLLARARARDPAAGYATDLPGVLAALAEDLKARGIRVVTNAGGVNPQACKAALEEKLAAQGIALKIAIVTGDDLLPRAAEFAQLREMFSGEPLPASPWSFNAYLGAFPIAAALADGADIVITGRCVDSALALGPLIHAFGWTPTDYDRLSAGSLAGHVIECGVQATGGIATDWEAVVADWDHMGFPIAICEPDGSFVLTKPAGTGGRVVPETVAEQIVYEVGDPAAYLLPDVSCDWRDLRVEAAGPDRVRVSGARGRAPSPYYKCSVTAQEGFRCATTMMVGGLDAVRKAEAVGGAVLARTRRMFAAQNLGDYRRTHIEVLGAESNWGAHARRADTREVILKIAVQHADKRALEIFSRECIPAATAMAQGLTGFAGGRPTPSPLVRLWSCLVPKAAVPIQIDAQPWSPAPIEVADDQSVKAVPVMVEPLLTGPVRRVRLIDLAYGRSGDKGDAANIGVLARRPEFVPVLSEQLTAAAVKDWFAHFVTGSVERYEWPGLQGFNFLMQGALGGGGIASLRHDPQGKMFAQILMDFPLDVPEALFESRA